MKLYRYLLLLPALLAYVSGFAQSASLKADSKALSPNGGEVVLTASATYTGQPDALGWSIELPSDWSLVSVAGAYVPAIAPEAGTTGTLEFAFTRVPAGGAVFTVTVHYPRNVDHASVTSTFILRANDALVTLHPEPVAMAKAVDDPRRHSDK